MSLETGLPVASDRDDPRVLEDSSVESGRLFSFTVEPQAWTNPLNGAHDILSGFCELGMRYLRGGDCPYELEPAQIVADIVEQPLPATE